MTPSTTSPLDLDRLLKLRVVVARHGEMDGAKWWNTQGMLGRLGVTVLSRSFPRTHWFAQARVVFAVAKSRCHEVFDPPGCITLWNLPADAEDAFDAEWPRWADEASAWAPFFQQVSTMVDSSLTEALMSLDLMTARDDAALQELHRSAEGRAVMVPGLHQPSDEVLTMLAAGFALGEVGAPAVPYARLEE